MKKRTGRPTLTKEEIEQGFHIWTEFTELITTPKKTKDGYELVHKDGKQMFEHWKKCPCERDIRLK